MESWRVSCPKCGSYKNHFTGEDWTGYPPDYVCESCGNVFSRPTSRAVDEGDSAPLQAESTPEHSPIEEADTTPALRN